MTGFDLARFRAEYGAFLGVDPARVLLTGHSHQAWPDVAKAALLRCFDDAARYVDDKWGEAIFPLADRVGRRILARLGFAEDDPISFGSNTHELGYRVLSALPRDARVVTTTGEFHSLHRQLCRLEEDGLAVRWVEGRPRESLVERLVAEIRNGADLVAVSAVFFEDAFVLPGIDEVASAARAAGATLLLDAYHAFNVVPLAIPSDVYVLAGGYKYAEFGEGVCFLRSPPTSSLRPRHTGWFADFASLEAPRTLGSARSEVRYGASGARFSGSTFDASGLYRADAVLAHFDAFGLDVPALRAINIAQTERIVEGLDRAGLEIVSPRDPARRGGFVAARVEDADAVAQSLRASGVFVDARGSVLRLGPAPYLTNEEIDRGVLAVVTAIERRA